MLVAKMSVNDESTQLKKSFGKELLRRLASNYEQYLIKNGLPSYSDWKSRLESSIDEILSLIVKDSSELRPQKKNDRITKKDYFTWASLEDDVLSFSEWLEAVGMKQYLLQQLGLSDSIDEMIDD